MGWELAAPQSQVWAGKMVQLSDRSDITTEGQLSSAATCCHSIWGSQFATSHFVSWVELCGLSGSRVPALLEVLSRWDRSSLWALRADRSRGAAPALVGCPGCCCGRWSGTAALRVVGWDVQRERGKEYNIPQETPSPLLKRDLP